MMKDKNKMLNIVCYVLAGAIVVTLLWGLVNGKHVFKDNYDDGIEQIDLDTIYLNGSKVEVDFSEVIIGTQEETRKLIVSTQEATVSTELTSELIRQLDFNFLKKTQKVSTTIQMKFQKPFQRVFIKTAIFMKRRNQSYTHPSKRIASAHIFLIFLQS